MQQESPPSDNVYVAGLPAGINEQHIRQIFGQYAVISQCRVLPSSAGQAKCAALVRFASVQDAAKVVNFTGQVLQGLSEPVQIKYAATPEMKAQRANNNFQGGPQQQPRPQGGKGQQQQQQQMPGGKSSGKGQQQNMALQGPMQHESPQNEQEPVQPHDNLYVSGLPSAIDTDTVRTVFQKYGEVKQCRVLKKPGADGKASALIRYSSVQEAVSVKDNLNRMVPEGLPEPVNIEFAGQPTAPRDDEMITMIVRGFEACGCMPGGNGFSNDQATLYIAGLPPDTQDLHLYRIFAPFGSIAPKGVHAVMNPDNTCKGIGFVNYISADSAQAAIKAINGTQLPDGTVVKVAVKGTKKDR